MDTKRIQLNKMREIHGCQKWNTTSSTSSFICELKQHWHHISFIRLVKVQSQTKHSARKGNTLIAAGRSSNVYAEWFGNSYQNYKCIYPSAQPGSWNLLTFFKNDIHVSYSLWHYSPMQKKGNNSNVHQYGKIHHNNYLKHNTMFCNKVLHIDSDRSLKCIMKWK